MAVRTELAVILRVLICRTSNDTGNGSRVFVNMRSLDQFAANGSRINHGDRKLVGEHRSFGILVPSSAGESEITGCFRSERIGLCIGLVNHDAAEVPLISRRMGSSTGQGYRSAEHTSVLTADLC